MADLNSEPSPVEIQFPNEYFHTVAINMLWHPDGGVAPDAVVNPEDGTLRAGVKRCTQGTGFFYRFEERNYLATARHCFTDRAWRTNDYLEPPVTPTHLMMRVRTKPDSGTLDANRLGFIDFCLKLVDDDENPLWFEHSRGVQVDIAARPLDDLPVDELLFLPLEPKDAAYGTDPRFWVTDDVYTVGYPFGLDHGFLWPIWMRGTVASEPALYFPYKGEEYPLFLVDSRTRPGQSGSPVFLRRRHFTDIASDDVLPRLRLIGIYSGRLNEESELGFAWHIGELDRLCHAKQNAQKSKS
jgi:hypothetical protein